MYVNACMCLCVCMFFQDIVDPDAAAHHAEMATEAMVLIGDVVGADVVKTHHVV